MQSPSGLGPLLTDRKTSRAHFRGAVVKSLRAWRTRERHRRDRPDAIASGVRGEASCPARMRAETSGAIPWSDTPNADRLPLPRHAARRGCDAATRACRLTPPKFPLTLVALNAYL